MRRLARTTMRRRLPRRLGLRRAHRDQEDVIARANGICINALRACPLPAAAHRRRLAGGAGRLSGQARTDRGERGVPYPRAAAAGKDRAILNRYVAAVTAAANQYRAVATAASKGDAAGVSQGLAALRVNPASALAARYGLVRCNASAGTGVT